MTLEEIRKAKAALEEDLRKAIHPLLSAFAAKTGCHAASIGLAFIDLKDGPGQWARHWAELARVSVEIETGL